MEKVSLAAHVRDVEVLLRVKEGRNSLRKTKRRKIIWIGHILRRNCFLIHVIEGTGEGGIEEKEQDVSNYWIKLRKVDESGNL
jgi:hypothetical protein